MYDNSALKFERGEMKGYYYKVLVQYVKWYNIIWKPEIVYYHLVIYRCVLYIQKQPLKY